LPTVFRPSSLEDAGSALAAAHAEGRTLRIGEALTTEGLDRILEHEAGDLTCTVEAGVKLSMLQSALAPYGQRLSLDPPGDPTIGALLAENVSGPLRHRFGAPRDLVLGVTLVLADGTIASSGGKVVKNVAGYDLARLVCGSRGRLALIGRASFRLHPVPKAAQTLAVESENAVGVVAALLASQLEPSALDVLHPGPCARPESAPADSGRAEIRGVLVLFEGSPAAVGAQVAAAQAVVGGREVDSTVWETSRRRQADARGRTRFEPGRLGDTLAELDEAVVRASSGVAYTRGETVSEGLDEASSRLLERIRERFDPAGVLAA
jgi:glycolate oxidase FAD binding subunit